MASYSLFKDLFQLEEGRNLPYPYTSFPSHFFVQASSVSFFKIPGAIQVSSDFTSSSHICPRRSGALAGASSMVWKCAAVRQPCRGRAFPATCCHSLCLSDPPFSSERILQPHWNLRILFLILRGMEHCCCCS